MPFVLRNGLVCLGLLAPVFSAVALTADNPYRTIVDRNPFGLNPPVVTQTNVVDAPPRSVKFNGITSIGGRKKAFFTLSGKDPKDPPQYLTLAESEKADVLEVTKISKEEGEVEVINSGIHMVLNFKNNGNKANGGSAPVVASAIATPTTASVVYNPGSVAAVGSSMEQNNNPVVFGANHNVVANNSPSGVVAGATAGLRSTGAQNQPALDPVSQRMNMLANHLLATREYESGGGFKTFQRQSTGGPVGGTVTHRITMPPPPPPPPAPPGLAAQTGE